MLYCPVGKNKGTKWADMTERQLGWYCGIGEGSADKPFDGALAELSKRQDHAAAEAEMRDQAASLEDNAEFPDDVPF